MTDEQIKEIKFRFISHLAMSDRHISEYEAVNMPFELTKVACVPMGPFGEPIPGRRASTRYCLNGTIYRSKQKLEEALRAMELKDDTL